MITLSSSLLAHQRGATRRPSLSVVATNKRASTHLLKWSRWYTGSETDSPHASCVAADGSLVRARNDGGNLQISRVAVPTSGSTYSSWTLLVAGLVAGSGVALAAQPGEVTVLYTRGTTLYTRTSADNGATWAAETAILAVGVAVGFVALAFNLTTADACAFYTTAGTTVSRLRRTAGAWAGAGTAWTLAAATVTGVAACHNGGDFALLVSGTETVTTHKRVWVTLMGDTNLPANAWATLVSVAESDTASTTTFAGPFIVAIGADVHGAYSHKEAGAVTYDRAFYSRPASLDANNGTWSEPAPHEASTAHGLALAYLATGAPNAIYATSPAGVWAATINQSTDLSPRVLTADVRFAPESARCTLELDNADAVLLTAPGGLATGAQLELTPGYLSGAAAAFEGGAVWNFTVDAIEHRAERGARTTAIFASGPWEQLAHWHAPQAWQSASAALTRAQLAGRLAGRAGFPLATGSGLKAPSSDWTATSPSFALTQGESAAAALTRLLAVVNDAIRTDSVQAELTGLTAYPELVTNPSFEDNASGWIGWNLGTIARSTAYALQGAASLQVLAGAVFRGAAFALTAAAATSYTFGCWVYCPNPVSVAVNLTDNIDQGLDSANFAVPANTWTYVSFTATTDAHTTRWFAVYLNQAAAETFYIDAASVIPANGAPVYAYGGAGNHPISALTLTDTPPLENWTRVQGPNRYADALDLPSVYQHGPRRGWLRFLDATSDQRATNAATNNLRRAQWAQPRGVLTAAFNAGLQLFDLISLTAPNLNLNAPQTYRVIGLRLRYSRHSRRLRPAYDHELTLGGP